MKKIIVSSVVVFGFILYSLLQRREETPQVSVQQEPTTLNLATPAGVSDISSTSTSQNIGKYKDGEYTGSMADAFYGNIQVKAVIQNGQIVDVQFLQYPNDRETSIFINSQAMPLLKQEAIKAQSAKVNIISGATDSSRAFIQSLSSALLKAI